jgi:hypothetical protein
MTFRPTFPLFIVLLLVVVTTVVTASDDLGSPAVATSAENDAANGTGNLFSATISKIYSNFNGKKLTLMVFSINLHISEL